MSNRGTISNPRTIAKRAIIRRLSDKFCCSYSVAAFKFNCKHSGEKKRLIKQEMSNERPNSKSSHVK